MKTLYLDCFCGISGDMTVAALIHAGADVNYLRAVTDSLHLPGTSLRIEDVHKHGIFAKQFQILLDPSTKQPHRHLREIVELVDKAAIDDSVRKDCLHTFMLLAEAESRVHGIPVENVHFHEVGAIDSILDIVLATAARFSLGIEQVLCSPLTVGSGITKCDHGLMPVPAPATAILLEGIPWQAGDVEKELVTPTGAAIVRNWASAFTKMPEMIVHTIGYGAGTRNLPDRANVLRVFIGETGVILPKSDALFILETTVDDMNPELMALLIPHLLESGAKDVFVTPVLGKKGRIAQHLTVLTDPARGAHLAEQIFCNTTTLGIRFREEHRWILDREIRKVLTTYGEIHVKVGIKDGKSICFSPEFEDCRIAAMRRDIPVRTVYEAALAAAIQGDFTND